jgi:5-methyltetrahydrofolate--homocysteine methyltransferase
MAARAMKSTLAVLQPHLSAADVTSRGKVVLATVQGDLHDIGKGLVRVMLEGAGFEVIDLAMDVAPGTIVTAVRQHRPDLVGMSSLLTTTMPAMEQTVAALEQAGLRSRIKVIIGGAPVTNVYAQQSGADLYAHDAASAVRVVGQALEEAVD